MKTFGTLLRDLRTARGVSLRRLSHDSGVSVRTLSYWEAGVFQPRVPEMEAVLGALHAQPAERVRALTLLRAPRGVRRFLQEPAVRKQAACIGPMPSAGDLLRAMRHRRRMRLEDVANALGTSTPTVSRWERSGVVPPPDRLDELFGILRPHPRERAALTQGSLLLASTPEGTATSLDSLRDQFDAFQTRIFGCIEDPLHDLRFLAFTAQAWPFATRAAEGRALLAEIHARHASYLVGFHRYAEAGRYANQALALMPDPRAPEPVMLRAAIAAAEASVHRRPRAAPRSGLELLAPWQAVPRTWDCYSWMLANIAAFQALQGESDTSVALVEDACHIAESGGNSDNLRLRRLDLARIHIRAGRAEEALDLTTTLPKDTPFRRADVELLLAEAHLALGDAENARVHSDEAMEDIRGFELNHLQPRLDAVQSALAQGRRHRAER